MKSLLTSKLSVYSAFAGVILATDKLNAQIVYTDIFPDDTLLFGSSPWYLDLNNDGQFDFDFYGFEYTASSKIWHAWRIEGIGPNIFGGSGGIYLQRFNENSAICSFSIYTNSVDYFFWINEYADIANQSSGGDILGGWTAGDEGFLALGLFDPVANTINYGWLRIRIASDYSYIIMEKYACDSIPDECITINESIAVQVPEINNPDELNIFPNPASSRLLISGINRNFKSAEVSIMNLSGREIFSGSLSAFPGEVETAGFPTGMYVLKLNVDDKLFIRKFVVER